MIAADLCRRLMEFGWPDTPVVGIDEFGRTYRVMDVAPEPQSDDGEGHVISTGATIWLRLEET